MNKCPKCGREIPVGAPEAVCPSCLLDETYEFPESAVKQHGSGGKRPEIERIGNFRLIEEIARGGMGVVYRAVQEDLDRMVAVKMIRGGRFADEAELKRFRSEAEAVAKLRHPGIVAIHQVGEEDGNHFFSMDLIEGGNLDSWLVGRTMEDQQAARLLRQIAEAVHYAHGEGIIHRDLKPHNILMDADGNPHITDFGIAKRLDSDAQLTVTGVVMGSPSYMSPEQATGDARHVRETSDLYSLGAILYFLLTGRPPFQSASSMKTLEQVVGQDPVPPKTLNPSISDDLNTLCLKSLSKDPRSRYQSALELIEELDRFCAGQPILARPIGRTEKTLKWVRRNPLASSLCAVIAAVALAGFLSVWWQLKKTESALEIAEDLRRAEISAQATALPPKHILPHEAETLSVAFAPNGTDLLTGSGDGEWRLFSGRDGKLQRSVKAHGGMIAEVAYDEDGDRILTFSYDSQTHFPRIKPNGEAVLTYSSHSYGDRSARLWDAATGTNLLTITNQTQMTMARLSPDGKWVAISAWDGVVEIYDAATGSKQGSHRAHKGAIQGLEFSPDSQSLVTASEGYSYNKVLTPTGGGGSSSSVHEKFLAHVLEVPSAKLRVSLPNLAHSGILGLSFLGSQSSSRCTARFSPDGTRIVTAGQKVENTGLWDSKTGRLLGRLDGHAHSVYMAVFSPNGDWIATGSADNTAMIWNAHTGERWMTLKGHEGPVMWVEFSPDSRMLATSSGDGTARVWDVGRGVCVSVLRGHTKKVYQARFSPDGLRVATASEDGTACIWDAASMEHLSRVFRNHDGVVAGMEFAADSRRFATRSRDGVVRVWELDGEEPRWTLKGTPEIEDEDLRRQVVDEALFARFTVDGSSVITLVEESRAEISIQPWLGLGGVEVDSPYAALRVWDLNSGALKWAFPRIDKGIGSVDVSPDGQLLAGGQQDVLRHERIYRTRTRSGSSGELKRTTEPTSIWIWDLKTGEMVRELEGHVGKITMVRFSPDNSLLISSDQRTTRLWDLASGHPLRQFKGVSSASDCSFLPDGKRVMLCSVGRADIWSLESGESLARFSIHGRLTDIRQCVLSPNSQFVACQTWSDVAYLCSSVRGEVVMELSGHRARITDMAFHPDGELLATSSEDKSIKVWSVSSGELIRTLEGHKEPVTAVVFSPDGKWLGSTSRDFTARLWPVSAF